MRIHLYPLHPKRDGTVAQAHHLARLAALDPGAPGELTDDPDAADVLLLTDVVFGGGLARALLTDPLLRRHRAKLFVHSETARPFRVLPGTFTSMPRSPRNRGTVAAVGYPCWGGALNAVVLDRASRPPGPRAPDLLYSFVGKDSHPVRRRLFAARHDPDTTVVRDTSGRYRHQAEAFAGRTARQRAYVDVALRSRFALCPRGWATSTLRLYEMLALGVAPVILADDWIPPPGPDWDRCALFVPEGEAARIPELAAAAADRWEEMGREARRAWDEHFRPERQFRQLAGALAGILPEADAGRRALTRRWPGTLPAMTAWRAGYRAGERLRRRLRAVTPV